MGAGRTERRGTLKSSAGRPLNNGSRHRAVESYIFGSQVDREWRRRECRGGVWVKETEEEGLRGVGGGKEEVNVEDEGEGEGRLWRP